MRSPLRLTGSTAVLLLAALTLVATPALAHADLMGAEPEPNTQVQRAPERLVLDFSEPLEDTYTAVEVVDGNGTDHVEGYEVPEDDRLALVAELSALEDGVYTVRWQALSSADGHTTSGSYLLGVNASLSDGPQSDPDGSPDGARGGAGSQVGEGGPGEAALRGLGFTGASLAVGIPLFCLVARGVLVPDAVSRRWSWLAIGGALTATLASLALVAALGARLEVPFEVAAGTTPGENLLLRAGAFATASVLVALGELGPWRQHRGALTGSGTLAALAGLLVTSLGSHAAAGGVGNGLLIVVDWLHQAAVAFWIGGVAALLVAGLSATREEEAARLIRRFSPLAVASVTAIVITGLIAAWDRLTIPADLAGSLYGFALSAKMLLLVPLLVLGAYHRYRLMPQLETPGHERRDVGRLRRSASIELGLMLVVLLAAGIMASTSPPTPTAEQAPYASFDEAWEADTPGPFTPQLADSQLATLSEQEATNVTVRLLEPDRIDELAVGDQPVWVLLADETGGEPTPITDASIQMQAWMSEHGHGTTGEEIDPAHVHEGMYEGATDWIMPGAWQLRLNVTLASGDVLHYEPTLFVGQAAEPIDVEDPFHRFSEDGFTVEVFLSPEPVQIGVQNLTVKVTPPPEGWPDNPDVVVNLRAPGGGGEGNTVDMQHWREDAWSREEAIFTETGSWEVLVAFQGRSTYVQDTFPVDVRPR